VTAFDSDDLPPVRALILEVLGARHRTGETLWTFQSHLRPHLSALEAAGLISVMHGIEPRTLRARLTEAGKQAALAADYLTPLAKAEARARKAEEAHADLRLRVTYAWARLRDRDAHLNPDDLDVLREALNGDDR
jgi:DNA-binding MarR family transcriptional regulator